MENFRLPLTAESVAGQQPLFLQQLTLTKPCEQMFYLFMFRPQGLVGVLGSWETIFLSFLGRMQAVC